MIFTKKIIDQDQWGVSFSTKQCWNLGIDAVDSLNWLLDQGFRRFRIMSYWQDIEKSPGKYDFSELDRQFDQIQERDGQISLCLGARQPRWPETHYPDWSLKLNTAERDKKLIDFIQKIVKRYKKRQCLVSYQLENEALLSNFGHNTETNRNLLLAEYSYIKSLDPEHPIIMTTSDTVGIPVKGPIPDIVGFSFYTKFFSHKKAKYHTGKQTVFSLKFRAFLIKLTSRKASFIHELQLEPWGPTNIWEMSKKEQDKSMNVKQIKFNLQKAKSSGLKPIDLWGGEWWYKRSVIDGDKKIWNAVKSELDFTKK